MRNATISNNNKHVNGETCYMTKVEFKKKTNHEIYNAKND